MWQLEFKALAPKHLSATTETTIPVSFPDDCLLMVMGKMIKRGWVDQWKSRNNDNNDTCIYTQRCTHMPVYIHRYHGSYMHIHILLFLSQRYKQYGIRGKNGSRLQGLIPFPNMCIVKPVPASFRTSLSTSVKWH